MALPALADGANSVIGRIDSVHDAVVYGWAFAGPGQTVNVRVCADNRVVGEGRADRYDEGLERAGYGDGHHAFEIRLDLPFTIGSAVQLDLHDVASGLPVAAAPITLGCHDPRFLREDELDGRSVCARPPQGAAHSSRRRRARKIARKFLRPVKKVIPARNKQPLPSTDHPGRRARIDMFGDGSINSMEHIDQWPRLTLPEATQPVVSIIVPVFNQFHRTYQCMSSIILGAGDVPFEVILVDDCSSDATRFIESRVERLRVVRNESNLGFLDSCNKAAEVAQGDYLLFLNNDTEVEPAWLDEMYAVFKRFDQVGAVGAKLVYPDGRLQDAGGIVWNSGVPWNVGHGRDPADPEFNYVREVDYLTGAALMVLKEAWTQVGGFSEAYRPAYYEDTDLAFKLRDAGFRTLYCPQATVVHYEGCSNGTSLDSGVKQHQVINGERFRDRWKDRFTGLGDEGGDLSRNKDRNRGLRVLVIDHEFPRLGRDAGSYAAIQEMQLLLDLGCKLTFLPENLAWAGRHVDALQRRGIECVHGPWHKSLEGFFEQRGGEFDAVYITRFGVAERVLPALRKVSAAPVIFNNADLHFLREMRAALQRGDADMSAPQRTRTRELAVMSQVDAVLSYNDVEREIIASHLMRDDHIFPCPWVIEKAVSDSSLAERQHLAFLGGFAHPPNREAMDWFVGNVMPAVRRAMPELELHIWGSGLAGDEPWSHTEGVVVRGYADSLDQVFSHCRAFVAPLRSGAGIKGKVLDSVARGVPTILSEVAAEGTGLVDGASTLIARSVDEWVAHIQRLNDDAKTWQTLSENALQVVDTRYSREHGRACFRRVFNALNLSVTETTTMPYRTTRDEAA